MSSHREAPSISQDPVADNTDVYAFVSPDKPDTVTLIANYIPLEGPAGGPNFYEFGNDVLYQIHVDNDGDNDDDVTYQFQFHTTVHNPHTFLYNTGPIASLTSPNWNRVQTFSVTRVREGHKPEVLGAGLSCPPVNIGPRSTPNYGALAAAAVHTLPGGIKVFAGQRREGFFRRPRIDIRSRRPAALPEPAPHPFSGRAGRRCDEGLERSHDRDPDSQEAIDA